MCDISQQPLQILFGKRQSKDLFKTEDDRIIDEHLLRESRPCLTFWPWGCHPCLFLLLESLLPAKQTSGWVLNSYRELVAPGGNGPNPHHRAQQLVVCLGKQNELISIVLSFQGQATMSINRIEKEIMIDLQSGILCSSWEERTSRTAHDICVWNIFLLPVHGSVTFPERSGLWGQGPFHLAYD